jgi:hypothetical protein
VPLYTENMEEFMSAIENHPRACAFIILLTILTFTFRFHWVVGESIEDYTKINKDKEE